MASPSARRRYVNELADLENLGAVAVGKAERHRAAGGLDQADRHLGSLVRVLARARRRDGTAEPPHGRLGRGNNVSAGGRSALTALRKEQVADRLKLGPHYQDKHDLVFRDDAGRPMSRQRLNIAFKDVMQAAGLGRDWQPRETRHTFISIGSEHGASIEDLADAAGHVNANVTRAAYRHQISDTVTRAPAALDQALG